MAGDENGRALSTEEMLAEEADAILGNGSDIADSLPETLKGLQGQEAHKQRFMVNADDRQDNKLDPDIVEGRKKLYRRLNELKRGALCFSGGGIRSATFCLGILQALAGCDVIPTAPKEKSPGEPLGETDQPIKLENSLLGCFHYLSTVSGGGYLGSWLSAWRTRANFAAILDALTKRPDGPDIEPPQISWLRAYSNYLTPRLGVTSADAWAAVAIVVRNLILNWLIIVPVVCLVLLAFKLTATVSAWMAQNDDHTSIMNSLFLTGALFLILAQAFATRNRPARHPPTSNVKETHFIFGDLVWAVLSALLLTIFFSSRYFCRRYAGWTASVANLPWLADFVHKLGLDQKTEFLALSAIVGLLIYAIGWIVAFRARNGGWDFTSWTLSGLVYGALVGLGAYLYTLLEPYPVGANNISCLLVATIFGVPWILMAQLAAENVFVGLSSYGPHSDSDREWLGRAAGWLAAIAIAWAIVAFLVFAGGYAVQDGEFYLKHYIVTAGGVAGVISGVATALLGSSSNTPAKSSGADQTDYIARAYNIGLALAGPIFTAALIIALSVGIDKVLIGDSLVKELHMPELPTHTVISWLLFGFAVMLFIGGIASYCVNINRFSLHALYRNRLTRAYLGASRDVRHPDLFTGFDAADNVRMHALWQHIAPRCLFHVVNIALNVVSTKRLAWQERKAESFTATAKHCGSAYVGFRKSEDYGDSFTRTPGSAQGIALGTAMAISGAAVSPNMGYHSSPSITLLLTLFNVRLGWWLGNPGSAGDQYEAYRREGPGFAALPLFSEALGLTTDTKPYVYLSDGGHFENLGLYEMVRRRCRFIVVVDAGCDPDFTFEDLGNAVRKIYIDLGVRIELKGLQRLRNRPAIDDPPPETIPYHAIGTIHYNAADGEGCEDGKVIYIKPAYHGTEGAAIRSYAQANDTFPHETTTDQWFTESQFESYRALGLDIGHTALHDPDVRDALYKFLNTTVHQPPAQAQNGS